MRLAWKRLKVYVRGGLITLVAVAIGLVLLKNRGHEASIWFFGLTDESRPINVVWLIVWTAGATRISWWVFSLGLGLWRDMREVRRAEAVKQSQEELAKSKAKLDELERRIEEKSNQGVADDNPKNI